MEIKAYSYLRFSTAMQSFGDSSRRQIAMAEAYAAKHGLQLDNQLTFRDLGVSAYRSRNAKRGALRDFLDAVESGLIASGSFFLVESMDRISRDHILEAQAVFLQIISSGINLVTLIDERSYSKQHINEHPFELIVSLVSMMRANEESMTKSRRLREAWARRRDAAHVRPMNVSCPGWLTLDKATNTFKVVPKRGNIVKLMFSEYLSGKGPAAIAKLLNERGMTYLDYHRPTRCWWPTTVKRLLSSPTVTGVLTPSTSIDENGRRRKVFFDPIPGYYPVVIRQEVFDAVQKEISARRPDTTSRLSPRPQPFKNALSGLARCSSCGSAMYLAGGTGKGFENYYLACERAGLSGSCSALFIRYNDTADALLSRVNELKTSRSFFADAATIDDHHTPAFLEKFERTPGEHLWPLNPILADAIVTLNKLSYREGVPPRMLNEALKKCLSAVVPDRVGNRLFIRWRDGVAGVLEEFWAAPAPSNTRFARLGRSKRRFQADGESMHEAYGYIRGQRDFRLPLLTLAQVEDARRRHLGGETKKSIAADFEVSEATVSRRLGTKKRAASVVRTAIRSEKE